MSFLLTRNGTPCASVIVPETVSEPGLFAASEFRRYIKKISGAELSISRASAVPGSGNIVLIGKTEDALKAGLVFENFPAGTDDYLIKIFDERILLLSGVGDRGCIYAVYDFLRTCLGCRFPAPGAEFIPGNDTVSVNDPDRIETPAFRIRIGWDFSAHMKQETSSDYFDWALKNRLHIFTHNPADFADKGGVISGSVGHSFDHLVSPDEYGKEHPEYFALVSGERKVDLASQPCTSNPEVMEIATHNLRLFLRENPGLDFVSLCPNDNFFWCECEKCRALDSGKIFRKAVTKDSFLEFPVVSDRLWIFINKLIDNVSDEFPDQNYYIFAYNNYLEAPEKVKPHKNAYVSICHMSPACYAHSLNDPECSENLKFRELIGKWTEIHDKLFFYAYTTKTMWSQNSWPVARSTAENIGFLYSTGAFEGFYSQALSTMWAQLGQNFYLMARKLWNPVEDTESILEEYFDSFYGAAGNAMKEFYDNLERAFSAPGNFIHHMAHLEARQFMTPELISFSREKISEALHAVTGDRVSAERVEQTGAAFEFAVLFNAISLMLEEYRATKDQSFFDEALYLFEKLRQITSRYENTDTFDKWHMDNCVITPPPEFRKSYYYEKWVEIYRHYGLEPEDDTLDSGPDL